MARSSKCSWKRVNTSRFCLWFGDRFDSHALWQNLLPKVGRQDLLLHQKIVSENYIVYNHVTQGLPLFGANMFQKIMILRHNVNNFISTRAKGPGVH